MNINVQITRKGIEKGSSDVDTTQIITASISVYIPMYPTFLMIANNIFLFILPPFEDKMNPYI